MAGQEKFWEPEFHCLRDDTLERRLGDISSPKPCRGNSPNRPSEVNGQMEEEAMGNNGQLNGVELGVLGT